MGTRLDLFGATKRYGTFTAVDSMSLRIESGDIFGLIGANGAGKTTTMRMMVGISVPDLGQVELNGSTLTHRARQTIGYMPEERGLYARMRVRTQLVHFARLHGLSKHDARTSAEHWISQLGLTSYADQSLESLSLGNQQRVQLAAALVHNPALLVLDEPFSGLDPLAVDTMCDVLSSKAAEGVPIVFSSHQLELVERMCNRVGVLHNRQLTELDLTDDVRERVEVQLLAPACPTGWAEAIEGVTAVGVSDRRQVFVLDPGTDDRIILQRAIQYGPVHEFTRRRVSLMARYREVVDA